MVRWFGGWLQVGCRLVVGWLVGVVGVAGVGVVCERR